MSALAIRPPRGARPLRLGVGDPDPAAGRKGSEEKDSIFSSCAFPLRGGALGPGWGSAARAGAGLAWRGGSQRAPGASSGAALGAQAGSSQTPVVRHWARRARRR